MVTNFRRSIHMKLNSKKLALWLLVIFTIIFFCLTIHLGYQYYFDTTKDLPFTFVYKRYIISWTVLGICLSVGGCVLIFLEIIPPTVLRDIVAALSAYEAVLILFGSGELGNMPLSYRSSIVLFFLVTWLVGKHFYNLYRTHARNDD